MTQDTDLKDVRVNREKKGWVLEQGFGLAFIEKNYSKDARIVDIGCGPGHWLKTLSEKGYTNVAGVDIQNFIIFPEVKALNNFHKVDVSFEKLPFADASVDLLLSMQVFEHLENPFQFERECARVLKPGGILIMSYPYAWSWQSRFKFLFKADVIGYRAENSHINFMTKAIFAKCFSKDFRTIRTEYFRGRVGILGFPIKLPASKNFGNGICYFLEKKYYR